MPIGIIAANKQTLVLMHMDYRVTVPDPDWMITPGHKLITSVYAGIKEKSGEIENRHTVSYLGPTHICIRSGKHSSSTRLSHAADFNRMLQQPSSDSLTKTANGCCKPGLIVTVNGGPDENPMYKTVITVSIHHFPERDVYTFFITIYATGCSAFNHIERRMAPPSCELAGLILPHEHYRSHLDSNGQTRES